LPDETGTDVQRLFDDVVAGGYCIGCGACAGVADSPIEMAVDEYGLIQPTVEGGAIGSAREAAVRAVCPFSGVGPNEDQIGEELFGRATAYDGRIGRHLATLAGWVEEGDYRSRGSSGGIGSWVVAELLKTGRIDGVIHVHHREPTSEDERVFEYRLSTTLEEICRNSKSQYYPIEMSQVVRTVRERPGRYAFIGVPCFNKAMRLLQRADPVLRERVTVCISLVCGHLKSMRWTEMMTWQKGMEPGTIDWINFRETDENFTARDYIFSVRGKREGQPATDRFRAGGRFTGNWHHGFFMYTACDYCDDVVGETADLTIGDAWIPRFYQDYRGTNLIIPRRADLLELLRAGQREGRVHLEPVTAAEAFDSQSGGLRHRREGLAYRLALKEKRGEWYPPKRVEPSVRHLSRRRRKLYRMRMRIARESHAKYLEARRSGDLRPFIDYFRPLALRCQRLTRSIPKRVIIKLGVIFRRLTGSKSG